MATAVLCLSVLISLCLAEREVLLKSGAFNFPFVHDEDIRHSELESTLYVTMPHRCVNVFHLVAEGQEDALVRVERITGATGGEYQWSSFGETILVPGTEQAIPLSPAPSCGSTWRLVIQSTSVTWKELSFDAELVETDASRKRAAVFCTYDPAALYPPECSSASDGALCVQATGQCGCAIDSDCFGNTDFPRCVVATGATTGYCDRCTTLGGGTNYNDHYFCRNRYPGFVTHPTDMTQLPNERAAPANYFREYCTRLPPESSGSCQRCNQAPPVSFPTLTPQQAQGASGTVHCAIIRPTTAPICMDQAYMLLTGATYDVNLRGSCVPCSVTPQCATALPLTPICELASPAGTCRKCATNTECSVLPGKNCQADGSCFSCTTNADCGTKDGGEKGNQLTCDTASGICIDPFMCNTNPSCVGKNGNNCQKDSTCLTCTSNANCGPLDGGETPNQQVCDTNTGICGPCANNIDCTGTSGNNCQADGSCLTCTSDATCGALDGGSTPNQPRCDTGLGICVTPFSCTDNQSCQNNPQSGGANCQASLNCVSCTTATCGSLDGGETPGQPNCNSATRQCVDACNVNNDCIGTQGNNCMQGGLCVTCLSNSDCNVDGGEVPNQNLCDIPTGICVSPCSSNAGCPAGQNCQADGSCRTCVSNNDCGILDGGEIPGQPICQPTGICGPCASNLDCRAPLPNCGVNGQCYNCADPGNTCGVQDGPPSGIGAGQERCDTEIGLCVDYCTLDEHCIDSCVPYCNVQKGCCVECKDNTHCPHTNWRGIEAPLIRCSTQSGVCTPGCLYDYDCGGSTPACDTNTRTCVECVHDYHCNGTDTGGDDCLEDLTCGNNSDDSRAIAIAALILACLGLCIVLIVIGLIVTKAGGPEHV